MKEEKAKEYAKSVVDKSVENYIGEEIFNSHIEYASQCYLAGYTQAEQDLSSQLSEYKEALREAIQALTDISEPIEYLRKQMPKDGYKFDLRGAVEFSNNGISVSGMAKDPLSKLLTKSKTLIE